MSRDVLALLSDGSLAACRVEGARWPRGLLSKAPIPDGWVGLVEARDGRRRFVPGGQEPDAERDDTLVLVRDRVFAVGLKVRDAEARCGKPVSGECEVELRWEAREDDLAALRRGLLQGETLTVAQLSEAVRSGGGSAGLAAFIRSCEARELVSGDSREALLAALREQLKRFLFEAGARLVRVTRAEFSSAALEHERAVQREARQRVQAIQAREMVEDAARAAMTRRIDGLSGVLDKLRTAAAGDDALRWHELLPALSPPERGRLLENLWRISPDRHKTKAIVAVGADEVAWLDPEKPQSIAARRRLPGDLGGLRSVRHLPARRWLLVGAATGVWVLREDDGEVVMRCEVPTPGRPKTGFNAACVAGAHLYGTHSQLGFWRWSLDGQVKPLPLLQTRDGLPKAVRAVTALPDGRVIYSIDARVQVCDPQTEQIDVLAAADGVIHCLAVQGDSLFMGTDRGTLLRCDWKRPADVWSPYRRSGALESVQARAWNDLVELVVPGGDAGILAVYEHENVVARLGAARFAIRQVEAADDVIVGLSDRRDELLVLNANPSQQSSYEAPLSRWLGASVQDVCLIIDTKHVPAEA